MTDTDPNGFHCPNLDTIDDKSERLSRFEELSRGLHFARNFKLAADLTEDKAPPPRNNER